MWLVIALRVAAVGSNTESGFFTKKSGVEHVVFDDDMQIGFANIAK